MPIFPVLMTAPASPADVERVTLKVCDQFEIPKALAGELAEDMTDAVELPNIDYGSVHGTVNHYLQAEGYDVEGVTGEVFTQLGGKQ